MLYFCYIIPIIIFKDWNMLYFLELYPLFFLLPLLLPFFFLVHLFQRRTIFNWGMPTKTITIIGLHWSWLVVLLKQSEDNSIAVLLQKSEINQSPMTRKVWNTFSLPNIKKTVKYYFKWFGRAIIFVIN